MSRLIEQLVKCKRMTWQVWAGIALIAASHLPAHPKEQETFRDAGCLVITAAVANWMAGQGKRRKDSSGTPIRDSKTDSGEVNGA